MKKILLIPILTALISCNAPEIKQALGAPELYPTEKCTLNYQGVGTLILIDKTKNSGDTIFKSKGSTFKTLNLIKRGYYELKVINSNQIYFEISNPTKVVAKYNGNTNGLIYQFFNK